MEVFSLKITLSMASHRNNKSVKQKTEKHVGNNLHDDKCYPTVFIFQVIFQNISETIVNKMQHRSKNMNKHLRKSIWLVKTLLIKLVHWTKNETKVLQELLGWKLSMNKKKNLKINMFPLDNLLLKQIPSHKHQSILWK